MSLVLSVDVEATGTAPETGAGRALDRVAAATERFLALLAEFPGARATFFFVGRVAERIPETVRACASAGHEVASHGYGHRVLREMTPAEFREDLARSVRTIEDLAGRKVLGFRAPLWSLTGRTAWAVDILAAAGLRYDSSLLPSSPRDPRRPFRLRGPGGGEVLEFPPTTASFGPWRFPCAGGVFLRILPGRALVHRVRTELDAGRPVLIHLHPWDLDGATGAEADLPPLPSAPLDLRLFFSLRLGSAEEKLRRILRLAPAVGVAEALGLNGPGGAAGGSGFPGGLPVREAKSLRGFRILKDGVLPRWRA